MKRLHRFLLALAFMMVLLFGCDNTERLEGDYKIIYPGFYAVYYKTDIISLRVHIWPGNSIHLFETVSSDYSGDASVYSTNPANVELFKKLAQKHEDYDFPGKLMVDGSSRCEFFAMDFTKVDVVSDADFDADHTAGSSLSDVVRLKTITPYPFVKSRYTETFDWDSYPDYEEFKSYFREAVTFYKPEHIHLVLGRENVHPVSKLASELTKDDLTLLGRGMIKGWTATEEDFPFAVLEFETEPELEKSHNIVITMTDDEGKEYKTEPFRLEW